VVGVVVLGVVVVGVRGGFVRVRVRVGDGGFPIVFGCSFLSDTYPDVS